MVGLLFRYDELSAGELDALACEYGYRAQHPSNYKVSTAPMILPQDATRMYECTCYVMIGCSVVDTYTMQN